MDPYRLWNTIGPSFDATRDRPWQVVVDWIEALPPRRRVLDLMGGNGRHAGAARAKGHDAVVADWSIPLARAARGPSAGGAIIADATRLPLRTQSFDAAMYVAGLHGIPDKAGRAASLSELHRVLRPEAPVLVTVWSHNAARFEGGPEDVLVPWRRDVEAMRTYHLYTPERLQATLQACGFDVRSCEDVAIGGHENVVARCVRH